MAPQQAKGRTKYSTIDTAVKLMGSFPPPREGRTVKMMDKFTALELRNTIIDEAMPKNPALSERLSFVLDVIFSSTKESLDLSSAIADSLTVPLETIHPYVHDISPAFRRDGLSETSLVKLYDSTTKSWNWILPGFGSTPSPNSTPVCLTTTEMPTSEKQVIFVLFNRLHLRSLPSRNRWPYFSML